MQCIGAKKVPITGNPDPNSSEKWLSALKAALVGGLVVRHIVAVEPMPRRFAVRPPRETPRENLNLICYVLIALASSHATSQRLICG
jgi:hypothetical protein